MRARWKNGDFRAAVIAQDDDQDWQESGYVAVLDGEHVGIARYGHCSCYSTFTALCGGGISDSFEEGVPTFNWIGTVDECRELVKDRGCLIVPGRPADERDHDYDHLMAVYDQLVEWFKKTGRW